MSASVKFSTESAMDSDDSEATYYSNDVAESMESTDDCYETANILGKKFHLPKELCENKNIFDELLSMSAWDVLNNEDKNKLFDLLPVLPDNNNSDEEKLKTINLLFENKLSRFGQTPLSKLFSDLQEGHYRPDIAHYRKLIFKAERRERKVHECERISRLAKNLILSRQKLLPGSISKSKNCKIKFPKLFTAIKPNNKRYLDELRKIAKKAQFELSDDEKEEDDKQTVRKIIQQQAEGESRVYSTLSKSSQNWNQIQDKNLIYQNLIQNYKKQRSHDSDQSELQIDEIKLKDIITRVNSTKTKLNINSKPLPRASFSVKDNEETDEENWIKTNIIKVENQDDNTKPLKQKLLKTKGLKIAENSSKTKKKRTNDDFEEISSLSIKNSNKKFILDETSHRIENSSGAESKTQICFLSLIRDIFCSTPNHRMKLDELSKRVNVWLKNPAASTNAWYNDASQWSRLLMSAIQFLSGEFSNQPEGFVPYLDHKPAFNAYQWIGAGRDSDLSMKNLYQYWLRHQHDMRGKLGSLEGNERKVNRTTKDEIQDFQLQERKRFENPYKSFVYRYNDNPVIVGPLFDHLNHQTPIGKARDTNLLITKRTNQITMISLVRDAVARLPNGGEGTCLDICKLLKMSQYLQSHVGVNENSFNSIVGDILIFLSKEADPCIEYDIQKKLWVNLHNGRNADDFEKTFYQNYGNRREVTEKNASPSIKFGTSAILPGEANKKKINALPSFKNAIKINAGKVEKTIENSAFDVEESLEAQAIIKTTDNKGPRLNVVTQQQNTIQKKIVQKPNIFISQSPSISTAGKNFVVSLSNTKVQKPNTFATKVTPAQEVMKVLQNKGTVQANPTLTRTVKIPQEKIVLTGSPQQGLKSGKIFTVTKNQTPMLSQQKQILTNVLVQQQKVKSAQTQLNVAQVQNKIQQGSVVPTSSLFLQQQQQQPTLVQGSSQKKQAMLQLKNLKGNAQTMIIKPQLLTAQKTTTTVLNFTRSPALTTSPKTEVQTTRLIQQQNTAVPKTSDVTLNTPMDVIQLNDTQYAMVSKDKKTFTPVTSQSLQTFVTKQISNAMTTPTQRIVITNPQTTQISTPIKIMQGGSISGSQFLNAKIINLQTFNNKNIKPTGGIKMLNTHGGVSKLSSVPIIIQTANKTGNVSSQSPVQSLVLNSSNNTILLNSQGQTLKGNTNFLTHTTTQSQPQTVMVGNQVLKVQPMNQVHAQKPQTSSVGETTFVTTANKTQRFITEANDDGGDKNSINKSSNQIVLGSSLKVLKNVIKAPNAQPHQTARVVLTSPNNQSIQQIILPANFQGIKTVQGFKVIQQARIVPYSNISGNVISTTTVNSEENKSAPSSSKEVKKE